MRNNETGEYELVVGNRQLLSGFFIVVLLCAVAFAMGYVVGENSHSAKPIETASSAGARAADARSDDSKSSAVGPSTAPSSAASDIRQPAADSSPQPTTKAARDVEPEAAPPPAKRQPAPAPETKAVAEPAPGQYWQVVATANRNSAETLVQLLKDKGFPATLSPGPNNLTRVLVGPYTDTASLGRAKTDLESNGFNGLVRK
jgi:cell division septation protein DedD